MNEAVYLIRKRFFRSLWNSLINTLRSTSFALFNQQIEVPTYFNEQMLSRVDVRPEDTRDDMMRFIKHEVAFRKIDVHLKKECIFCL